MPGQPRHSPCLVPESLIPSDKLELLFPLPPALHTPHLPRAIDIIPRSTFSIYIPSLLRPYNPLRRGDYITPDSIRPSDLAFLEVAIVLAGWENIPEGREEPAVNQPRRGEPCNGRLEIAPTKLGFASGGFDMGVWVGEFCCCQLYFRHKQHDIVNYHMTQVKTPRAIPSILLQVAIM